MLHFILALMPLCLAALPTVMVYWNLPLFHRAAEAGDDARPVDGGVSILIPARNEERGIGKAVCSALATIGAEVEVIVMDDHSTDGTAAVVEELSRSDARIRIVHAPNLPSDWNGKQHACWQLSQVAKFDHLLFMDADVRLEPVAVARLVAEQTRSGCSLLSGFPRQLAPTLAEQLLIPMMYYVLLGYLPLARMRASRQAEFGAGCGQLFLTNKADYIAAGGHAAIKSSRHDGLQLPRSFRRAGLMTDLVDASDLASVRMYGGWSSVLEGLRKNATEGMANIKLIGPFSVLLLGGSVLPILMLAEAMVHEWSRASVAVLAVATVLSFAPRAMIAARFEPTWLGAALHPLAVMIFVAVQWRAFIGQQLGWQPASWRGRP